MTTSTKTEHLIPLTDWQQRLSEGPRNKGKPLRFRYIIVAAKYEWTLAEERDGGLVMGVAHAARFADLCCCFKTALNLDPVECLKTVVSNLKEFSGENPTIPPLKSNNPEGWVAWADQIDKAFRVNYAIDDGIRQRLFGSDGDEGDEE